MRRELLVAAAALVGALVGYYLLGGRATPAALATDPAVWDSVGAWPVVGVVAGALGAGWLVNRLVERPRGTRGSGTPAG